MIAINSKINCNIIIMLLSSVDGYDDVTRKIAEALDSVVVSIE